MHLTGELDTAGEWFPSYARNMLGDKMNLWIEKGKENRVITGNPTKPES